MPCCIRALAARSRITCSTTRRPAADPARFGFCGADGAGCRDAARRRGRRSARPRPRRQDGTAPCRFTTFVGYEWTGARGEQQQPAPQRDLPQRRRAARCRSASSTSRQPERLWHALRRECRDGAAGLRRAHHPAQLEPERRLHVPTTVRADGRRYTRGGRARCATLRAAGRDHAAQGRLRVLAGGAASTRPTSSAASSSCPTTHFAGQIPRRRAAGAARRHRASCATMLRDGLRLEQRLGVNPFQYRLRSPAPTPTSAPPAASPRRTSSATAAPACRRATACRAGLPGLPEFNPGGLAVLWAEENTRDALFDAHAAARGLRAPAAPRPTAALLRRLGLSRRPLRPARLRRARPTRGGVPMGGELPARRRGRRRRRRSPSGRCAMPPASRQRRCSGCRSSRAGSSRRPAARAGVRRRRRSAPAPASIPPPARRAATAPTSCARCGATRTSTPPQPAFYYARVLENPDLPLERTLCAARGVDCDDPASVPRASRPAAQPTIAGDPGARLELADLGARAQRAPALR